MPEQSNNPTQVASPIADLSYRTYDGPLLNRSARWWIVAVMSFRLVLKKKGFWFVSLLAALPYVFFGFMLYIQSTLPMGRLPDPLQVVEPGNVYASSLFLAFSQQQFIWLFIIAMMVGPGIIASDNQTNALQVYLSKPITKGDYLLGKWMGIFLVVTAVAATPAIILYLYCLFSYTGEGFLKDNPMLIFRVLAASAIPGVVHASLLVGVSAWSKTPRMAGAIYAGFYFVSFAVANAVWGITTGGNLTEGVLARNLSVSGIITSLAQHVYGVSLRQPDFDERAGAHMAVISAPPLWAMLALGAICVVVGVGAARAKIRAVEVVRG